MRVALALTMSLAVLAFGCTRPIVGHDDFPGANVGLDLRGGDYEPGEGFIEPLPISMPPHVIRRGFPDQPWTPRPMVMNPVDSGVTAVAATRLAGLLPAPPKDWGAQEASAVTLPTQAGIMSEASRSYWSGVMARTGAAPDGRDKHRSIDITIIDRAQTGGDVVDAQVDGADERRNVTVKAVEVQGFGGQEFESGPGLKQLDIDLSSRFLVRVRGGHVSFEELRAWAAKIPLKDLAALR